MNLFSTDTVIGLNEQSYLKQTIDESKPRRTWGPTLSNARFPEVVLTATASLVSQRCDTGFEEKVDRDVNSIR